MMFRSKNKKYWTNPEGRQGVAVSLVTEDGRCGLVGKEPRGGQPIPPDRRNPGPPSRVIIHRSGGI